MKDGDVVKLKGSNDSYEIIKRDLDCCGDDIYRLLNLDTNKYIDAYKEEIEVESN